MRAKAKRDGWSLKEWVTLALFLVLVFVCVWATTSCTITPKQTQGSADTYSGNDANGGVVGVIAGGGIEVTGATVQRYEALIALYGKGQPEHLFLPALTKGSGVTPLPNGHFAIDREHWADFVLMSQWARSGRKP